MPKILDRILRAGEGRKLKQIEAIAQEVNDLEPKFQAMSDEELRELTVSYRARLADGETLDDLMVEAFATIREAARRTLGQRHYDVQLMGGAALHLGNIAEMKTGEGKTLVSTLAAYLNALTGKGVHVVTVNDYLAERDSEWMGRVHRFLGLSVGVILGQMNSVDRRAAYACDITYGTNNEFGFDYLRDNMAWQPVELVQRGHNFAIVDEVDSILIDEARTPLIISGPADEANEFYAQFARIVTQLKRDEHYDVDEKKRTVGVSELGITRVEELLKIDNLYSPEHTPLIGFLNNALKAKELFRKDRDYIVKDGEVLIVDEHTGRVLHGRRYSEGMHQSIEAREGVKINQENQTLATITLQNYFRLYEKLSGMTGTAMTEEGEFDRIYKLGVIAIPTNRNMVRIDQSDLVYRTEEAKFQAVVSDIAERHKKGQPVLVGTTSVEKSELLSTMLTKRGIRHEVLNAKHNEREASIVAMTGRKSAVTVSTNMAGRGTDIMLGGNAEYLASVELERQGLDPVDSPEEYEAAWPSALAKSQQSVAAEHDEVVALGGLYVLGTERHESRRIDNQLRGRSGRQGDPGETRFYLSLQDDLMRRFKSDLVDSFLRRFNVPDDVPIEAKMVSNAIKNAQTQVEQQNFEIRKNILKYDEVMNQQRKVIYAERQKVLAGADINSQITEFLSETISSYVSSATAAGYSEEWDLEKLWLALKQLYPIGISVEDVKQRSGGELDSEFLTNEIVADALAAYRIREQQLNENVMRELERRVVLSVLDTKWREHLYEMDYLQNGIGLRAMGQRDPLVEYQREGFDLFVAMMEAVKEESVAYTFSAQVQVSKTEAAAVEVEAPGLARKQNKPLITSSSEGATAVSSAASAEVPRNSLCPCGSGKKYKRCHGDPKNR